MTWLAMIDDKIPFTLYSTKVDDPATAIQSSISLTLQ